MGDLKRSLLNGQYIFFCSLQDVNCTYINVWTSSERLMYVQFTSCVYGVYESKHFHFAYPETSKWHLFWFNFMLLFSNYWIARKRSCFNLFIKESISPYSEHEKLCHLQNYACYWSQIERTMDRARGLRTEPSGTLWFNSFHELNFQLTFVLRDLLIK